MSPCLPKVPTIISLLNTINFLCTFVYLLYYICLTHTECINANNNFIRTLLFSMFSLNRTIYINFLRTKFSIFKYTVITQEEIDVKFSQELTLFFNLSLSFIVLKGRVLLHLFIPDDE